MTSVDTIRTVADAITGVDVDPDSAPWRPDAAVRAELRTYTAHIGAHPPVVGATPWVDEWPVHGIGPGVPIRWDPDAARPNRWQQHVCRSRIHALIDDPTSELAPAFVYEADQLWLVDGHHDLWLLVAARHAGLLEPPFAAYLHLPGDRSRTVPRLGCACEGRPPDAPRVPTISL